MEEHLLKENHITAIICATNYSDLLETTISENQSELDNIIVITNTTDSDTEQLCIKKSIKYIKTDIFYRNGDKFNRGMAYNQVFNIFKDYLDWVLLLDADIVLPKNFKKQFFDINPDINMMFSSRRYSIETYEDWISVKNNPEKLKNYLLYRGIGYGYFQLFNFKSEIIKNLDKIKNGLIYPHNFPTVANADWIFRNYWSDWIFDPPLDDNSNLHNLANNDRPYNSDLLRELPFKVCHLGESSKSSEAEYSRVSKKWNL